MASRSYECPARTAPEGDRLAWLKRSRAEAMQWLQTQPSYREFNEAVSILDETDGLDDIPEELSNVTAGEVRRNIREMVGVLSDLRALATFRTENKSLYNVGVVLDKLSDAWWYMERPKRQVKGSIQVAAIAGTGFLCPDWNPDANGKGRGNIQLTVLPPHRVLPVGLPEDGDYQSAYCVHLVKETPISQAHKKWWDQRGKISADRETPSWMRKGMQRFTEFLSPVLQMFGAANLPRDNDPTFPTVDIVYSYIDDFSVNLTGKPIVMGQPNTMWEYTVPSLGDDIPLGVNDAAGNPLYRKATTEDARLYPMRRLVIWCESGILYDDTSYWWHGRVPAIPVELDRWQWEAIGRPLTHDVVRLERSLTRVMRVIDDMAVCRASPPLVAQEELPPAYAEGFSPRMPNQTLHMTSLSGEPIKPILPADFYNLPTYIVDWVKYLEARIQRLMGVNDASALMKARQLPASDSIEKLREMAGPILKEMTESIELSMQELGTQWMWLAFEFYTAQRRIQVLGKDGITEEDLDYDPGTLVPSHLPGESTDKPSRATRLERAKYFAGQFSFFVTPGSLHQITQLSQKLVLLQLKKMGFPIDNWTLADIFNLTNFGAAPEGANTIMERWVAQQRMAEEAAARMAEQTGKGGGPGQGAGGGRPNTNARAPQIQQKDQGTRSSVVTS